MTQLARYDTRPALRWMCDLGFASLCSKSAFALAARCAPQVPVVFSALSCLVFGCGGNQSNTQHDIGREKRALSIEEPDAGRSKRGSAGRTTFAEPPTKIERRNCPFITQK